MGYDRHADVANEAHRDRWVADALRRAARPGARVLDVGAGHRPYMRAAVGLGLRYRSHDFQQYDGAGDGAGLQPGSWATSGHDVVCDLLDIPARQEEDIVLCTEVLEHVPDPVTALRHLVALTAPGGHLVVTVPLLSLMHQAPYWFSAGLSPYWFEHWAGVLDLEVVELAVAGDYVDLMRQEVGRLSNSALRGSSLLTTRPTVWRLLRRRIAAGRQRPVLDSGGFSTFFLARRPTTG